jgi:serine/threonine-protein kinase
MAYELLTGRLPFVGPTGMDMVLAHATEPPPAFSDIGMSAISPHVEEVVQLCLAKDPAHRPQSAAELAERFEVALLRAAEDEASPPDPELMTDLYENPPGNLEDVEPPPDDPSAYEFNLEAWMPQTIALLKLRGYVTANNGTILESVPGRIRVKLTTPLPEGHADGALRWIGLGRRLMPMMLDLRMTGTQGKESQLYIQARYRPAEAPLNDGAVWRRLCVQQFIDLRSYLIGATEND